MSRVWEWWYPRIGGIFFASTYVAAFRSSPVPESMHDVFTGVLTVTSITLGFLITAASTLLTIQDSNWLVKRGREAGAYRLLVEYIVSAARWNFSCAVLSAIAISADLKHPVGFYPYAFSGWLGSAAVAALSVIRVFSILAVIMRTNADDI